MPAGSGFGANTATARKAMKIAAKLAGNRKVRRRAAALYHARDKSRRIEVYDDGGQLGCVGTLQVTQLGPRAGLQLYEDAGEVAIETTAGDDVFFGRGSGAALQSGRLDLAALRGVTVGLRQDAVGHPCETLNPGVIAGIVIACVVGVAAIVGAAVCVARRMQRRRTAVVP